MKRRIVLRADGNAEIGMGHFMRALALSGMLKNDFFIFFATRTPSHYQKRLIDDVGGQLVELPGGNFSHFEYFLSWLSGDEIVVLDNYFFNVNYQRQIKAKGCRLVCIDDMHDRHYVADVVINHAYGLAPEMFSVEPYTQICLGQSYSLLREVFFTRKAKIQHEGKHVFICFGGSDIYNLTRKCCECAAGIPEISQIYAVIGNACPYKEQLLKYGESVPVLSVYSDLKADEMIELLACSDLAMVSASTILWEVISQNVRCIYGYYTDNQTDICLNLGSDTTLGVTCIGDWRKIEMSDLANTIKQNLTFAPFSGNLLPELESVPCRIRNLFLSDITVRKAQESDMMLYFEWVNEPEVRKNSFQSDKIDRYTHEEWFKRKLEDNDAFLYVCYYQEKPCGQVRFEMENRTAVIDISVDKEFRGKGLSSQMLKSAMEYLYAEDGISRFLGEVKCENILSRKLFLRAKFREMQGEAISQIKKYYFDF